MDMMMKISLTSNEKWEDLDVYIESRYILPPSLSEDLVVHPREVNIKSGTLRTHSLGDRQINNTNPEYKRTKRIV
jgi:hypothetical protein